MAASCHAEQLDLPSRHDVGEPVVTLQRRCVMVDVRFLDLPNGRKRPRCDVEENTKSVGDGGRCREMGRLDVYPKRCRIKFEISRSLSRGLPQST